LLSNDSVNNIVACWKRVILMQQYLGCIVRRWCSQTMRRLWACLPKYSIVWVTVPWSYLLTWL